MTSRPSRRLSKPEPGGRDGGDGSQRDQSEQPQSRRSTRSSPGAVMTPKLFVTHLTKLDERLPGKDPYNKTLWDMFSRSLYVLMNRRGRTTFENQVMKMLRTGKMAKCIEPLLASCKTPDQVSIMEDLCPALSVVHSIREQFRTLSKTEESIRGVVNTMLEDELSGKVEAVGRRVQFEAQKLVWNMYLGNRGFVEVRDNSAWESLNYHDKAMALITWVCLLDLLFNDSHSKSYKFFHTHEAFVEYARHEEVSFRGKWLRFKVCDQEQGGMLTYRLNIKVLLSTMKQGHSLDEAVLKCLEEFTKQQTSYPAQVESFAHFYYGKAYADVLQDLQQEDAASREAVAALNQSPMPPQNVVAAGVLKGGFLLHQMNFLHGATQIEVDETRQAGEWKSLEQCTSNNLRVLAMVRGLAREHHRPHVKHLVMRIEQELGKNKEEANKDVAALLWYVREEAPMLIHRHFWSLIPMMLTLDHYQSGHEASSFDASRSVPRPEWECKISAGLYAAEVNSMEEKKERPKYGALNIIQDISGLNGGVFYGATYITLKNLRRLSTLSFTDSACPDVHGVAGDYFDENWGMNGSECDLGCLDYAAGVICDAWSKNFLKTAIQVAHSHLSDSEGFQVSLRQGQLERDNSDFMGVPFIEGGTRQYDEVQIHGQIMFADNVESVTLGKPFVPDSGRNTGGKLVRNKDGKLIIINPVANYERFHDIPRSEMPERMKEVELDQQEFSNDNYYLFYSKLPLLDDFTESTPAFNQHVKSFVDEKRDRFREYVLDQQSQMVAMEALVKMDVPDHGQKYCFHLKTCLERLIQKYPSLTIKRVVIDPDTLEFRYEQQDSH